MLRNNAYSRISPDQYGNSFGSMIPKGTVLKTKKDLDMRDRSSELQPVVGDRSLLKNYNQTIDDAQKSVEHLKPIEKPEFVGTDFDTLGAASSAVEQGISASRMASETGGKGLLSSNKSSGKGLSKGGAAGIAAGTAVVGAVGAHQTANKNETVGGAMSGVATGASLGMTVGGPWGAAAGAVIGGIAGGIMGNKAKNRRKKLEKQEEAKRNAYNAEIAEIKRKTIGRAEELAKYQRIVNDASKYDSQGNLRFKRGGLLQYDTLNINEAKNYLKELEKNNSVQKYQHGGVWQPPTDPTINEESPLFYKNFRTLEDYNKARYWASQRYTNDSGNTLKLTGRDLDQIIRDNSTKYANVNWKSKTSGTSTNWYIDSNPPVNTSKSTLKFNQDPAFRLNPETGKLEQRMIIGKTGDTHWVASNPQMAARYAKKHNLVSPDTSLAGKDGLINTMKTDYQQIPNMYNPENTVIEDTPPASTGKKKKIIPFFRRGGKLDILKKHVIVDGPSHDDLNNTGVKNDRGLPVVKNGIKVAEIESLELVLESDAVVKIEELIEKSKSDPKAKEKLGDLLHKELSNNTYDYSELMKD